MHETTPGFSRGCERPGLFVFSPTTISLRLGILGDVLQKHMSYTVLG
jgi:hypothetical protein